MQLRRAELPRLRLFKFVLRSTLTGRVVSFASWLPQRPNRERGHSAAMTGIGGGIAGRDTVIDSGKVHCDHDSRFRFHALVKIIESPAAFHSLRNASLGGIFERSPLT